MQNGHEVLGRQDTGRSESVPANRFQHPRNGGRDFASGLHGEPRGEKAGGGGSGNREIPDTRYEIVDRRSQDEAREEIERLKVRQVITRGVVGDAAHNQKRQPAEKQERKGDAAYWNIPPRKKQ